MSRAGMNRPALYGVLLFVMSGGCSDFDRNSYLPTSPDTQLALLLSVDTNTIPADGFSTIKVTATITASASSTRRTVVFTTTAGTFAGSGSPETTTIEQSVVDSTSTTTVLLRSSRTVESATVTATVKGVDGLAKQEVVKFTAASPLDIITVSAPAVATADGETISPVTAVISGSLPAGRRTVTFTTTLGVFVPDPRVSPEEDEGSRTAVVDADGGNRAVAYLRSPVDRVGTAFITARVDATPAVTAGASVQFTRAVAQAIVVTADKATVSPTFTSTTHVKVTLIRDIGVPTVGTVVTFEAIDAANTRRGIFTNMTTSDDKGLVEADFAPGTLAALGTMVIRASVGSVSGSTMIEVE